MVRPARPVPARALSAALALPVATRRTAPLDAHAARGFRCLHRRTAWPPFRVTASFDVGAPRTAGLWSVRGAAVGRGDAPRAIPVPGAKAGHSDAPPATPLARATAGHSGAPPAT